MADSTVVALLGQAESALDAGRIEEAGRLAEDVVQQYPTAAGSSRALLLAAQAALARADNDRALDAADQYTGLFPADDARAAQGTVLAAQALHSTGQSEVAARRLLAVPPTAVPAIQEPGLILMREIANELGNDQLTALTEGGASGPLAAPIMAERAMALHFRGERDAARMVAIEIEALALVGPETDLAQAILDDRVEEVGGALPVLGAMLAETGSPSMTEFSSGIREGIDIALQAHADDSRRPVRLSVLDDRGSPAAADAVIRRLEDEGALAVVGPLLSASLDAAVPARARSTVLISPTSRTVPEGAAGVYSLAGPDHGAAEALAGYVRDRQFQRVVVLRPSSSEAIEETRAFREALEGFGLGLSRELAYDSGATFFQESLAEVAASNPDALVLPITAADVELLAPQITFFGLDTLGIQLIGTAGWTADNVVDNVDPRHTIGVVAASTTLPGQSPPGRVRFVQEYESRMRQTLRSPVPALGYDAAALILEAIRRSGARTPDDLRQALEQIEDFPGATGTISVRDGRLVRQHHLVQFDSLGVLLPLAESEPR